MRVRACVCVWRGGGGGAAIECKKDQLYISRRETADLPVSNLYGIRPMWDRPYLSVISDSIPW